MDRQRLTSGAHSVRAIQEVLGAGADTGRHIIQHYQTRLQQQKALTRDLVAASARGEPVSEDEFRHFVKLVTVHCGVAARRLSEALSIVPSAVSRWVSGVSAPRGYARASVLHVLAALMQEETANTERDLQEAQESVGHSRAKSKRTKAESKRAPSP